MSTMNQFYGNDTVSYSDNITRFPIDNESSPVKNEVVLTLEELNQMEVERRLAPMIYLGILILLGVPGNLTVLFVYLLKFETSTYRTFIVTLALIDLVGSAVCMPFEIIEMNFQYTFYAVAACKFFRFNNTFIALTSIFTLIFLSIDRYRRVCRPLKPQMTVFTARILSGVAALLAIFFSWPIFFLLGTRHVELPNNVTGFDCSTNDLYRKTIYPLIHNAIMFLVFVIAIISLIVIYILIGRKIIKHVQFRNTFKASKSSSSISSRKTSSVKLSNNGAEGIALVEMNKITSSTSAAKQSHPVGKKPHTVKSNEEKTSNKITKIAFAICVAFILSYLPHLIITLWTAVKGGFIAPPGPIVSAVLPIVTRSIFINNIVNPFIYGFLDRRFRRIILSFFCKK